MKIRNMVKKYGAKAHVIGSGVLATGIVLASSGANAAIDVSDITVLEADGTALTAALLGVALVFLVGMTLVRRTPRSA
jgi:uncharacterized MnhB-related membrane protein